MLIRPLRFTITRVIAAALAAVSLVAVSLAPGATAFAQGVSAEHVHDLSLRVSPEMPCVWPVGMTQHLVVPSRTFGPGAYHRDLIVIDEHTGTQFDAPAHFVPPPDSGLPGAGPMGSITGEKVPVWQFCGEACVIDVTKHIDDAPAGSSYLIRPGTVEAWEKAHRELRFGDVVLFRSGYTDAYYQTLPQGERFVHTALRKDTPGWPAPTPETMIFVAERGVMSMGLDSASMGPLPDLAAATHQAGGRRGVIWTECATNLKSMPATGGFYAILPTKHAGGSGGECRAIGITEPKLAARLIESARKKQVVDLSVTLEDDLPITWPGHKPGEEATRYVSKTLNSFSPARGPYFARTHILDGLAGTHVALPSFSLPQKGFDNGRYAPELREWLAEHQKRFGPRGTSDMSPDSAPLSAMMGEAHVVDVRDLVGSTSEGDWPASPAITLDRLKAAEKARPFKPGEVVIFYSGYSDAHFRPLPATPELDRVFAAPLAGKAEGWPAPTAEAIAFLADKGIRCVATDGPALGGVNPKEALFTYWAAANRGMFAVEYLTGVNQIADKRAFFIFAPIRIAGTRGGCGRAIALY